AVFTDNGVPITQYGSNPSCDGIEGSSGNDPYTIGCQVNSISPGTHVYQVQFQEGQFFEASSSSPITVTSEEVPTSVAGGSETASPAKGERILLEGSVLADGADP